MYKLSHAAESDIEEFFSHSIMAFGLHQSEHYYTQLKQCLTLIANNPAMGVDASDIRPGYRRFAHQSHIIFYTIDISGISVVRVLHKHMDAVRQLHEDQ